MSDDKSPAFPELPEAVESALADLLGAQFNLGLAAGKHGPRSIHSRMPVVIAAASAVQSTVDALRAALAAAQPPAAMHGWQLVPKDPTPEMVRAMAEAWPCAVEADDPNECIAEWKAAISAAPTPQAPSMPATGAQPLTEDQSAAIFKAWRDGPLWLHMTRGTEAAHGIGTAPTGSAG